MRPMRFYEKNPTVKKAVEDLLALPENIRSITAKGFCQIAERDFKAHELIKDLKSLGTETVLALYKSRLRRRPYDHDPHFHKAMNYLMIMSPDNQWFLAKKLQELVDLMRAYLDLCKDFFLPPQVAIADELSNTYVCYDAAECRDLLANVKAEFLRLFPPLVQPEAAAEPQREFGESTLFIESDPSGMRIRTRFDFA